MQHSQCAPEAPTAVWLPPAGPLGFGPEVTRPFVLPLAAELVTSPALSAGFAPLPPAMPVVLGPTGPTWRGFTDPAPP